MTKHVMTLTAAALVAAAAPTIPADARATDPSPTCSDVLVIDVDVHGEHVVGDYVTGLGHDNLEWPPRGKLIGEAVRANGGAVLPGGPGPGFHFPNNVPPGASFCVDASSGGRN
jgi:hypothetical protein